MATVQTIQDDIAAIVAAAAKDKEDIKAEIATAIADAVKPLQDELAALKAAGAGATAAEVDSIAAGVHGALLAVQGITAPEAPVVIATV